MATDVDEERDLDVLRNKRNATRYQILVEIAERQPAVSQQEIADSIGITAQAVSDYLQDLVANNHVEKQGRGRYEVTKEGVDWLISRTNELHDFVTHVSTNVLGQVEIEAAIATTDITEGQPVSLSMRDGVLHATPGEAGDTTAVAITPADKGTDVGVTDFEGLLDYEPGTVTIIAIPHVQDGGSRPVDPSTIKREHDTHDLLAVTGTEALVVARQTDVTPDIRFGTTAAVREAATLGLDVLVLATVGEVSTHADALRDHNISYEVIDLS